MFILSVDVFGTPLGRQASAVAVISSGFLKGISVTDGGSGYSTPPQVLIGGNGGATAVAILAGDSVSEIIVTSAGRGYTTAPAVSVAAPPRANVLQAISGGGLTTIPARMWTIFGTNSSIATEEFQSRLGQGFILKKDTNTFSKRAAGIYSSNIKSDQSVAVVYANGGSYRLVFSARVLDATPGSKHFVTVYRRYETGAVLHGQFSYELEVKPEKQIYSLVFPPGAGSELSVEFYNGKLTPSVTIDVTPPFSEPTARALSFPGETLGQESLEVTDVFVESGGSSRAGTFSDAVYSSEVGVISKSTDAPGKKTLVMQPGSALSFFNAYTGTTKDVLISFDGGEPRFPSGPAILVETNMIIRVRPVLPGYSGSFDEHRFEVTGPFVTTEVSGKGVILRGAYVWQLGQSSSKVTVEAIPELGWRFVRWEGSITDAKRIATLSLDVPKYVRAVFVPEEALSVGEVRITGTRFSQNPTVITFGLIAPTSTSVVIQTSEDLREWIPWVSLTTTQPITILSDPSLARARLRFYRVALP